MAAEQNIRDRFYFTQRARQERATAAACDDNAVKLTHLRMADEYDRRLRNMVAGPVLVRQ